MLRESVVTRGVGSVLLLVPVLFIAVNVLEYEVGVSLRWNPFDAIYGGGGDTALTLFFDALIVFGPVLACAMMLASLTTVCWHLDRNGFAFGVTVRRGGWLTLGLLGASLFAAAILVAYLIAENLPCILGQQVAC